jgi:general secretion pathway protein A
MSTPTWGLRAPAFRQANEPGCFYWSEAHREAMAGLLYGAAHRLGLVLLTGAPGMGKTTVVLEAAARLQRLRAPVRVLRISDPFLTPAELLDAALESLGGRTSESGRRERHQRFEDKLADQAAQGRTLLLVLDDAHRLSDDALEQVRLWTDLERDGRKLLPVVLVATSGLEEKLLERGAEPLRQRVALPLGLEPLSPAEVEDYIRFRWRAHGGAEPPFTRGALERIAVESGGVPRAINALCDQALRLAVAGGEIIVDQDQAQRAADSLLLPKARSRAAAAGGERTLQWVSYTKSS